MSFADWLDIAALFAYATLLLEIVVFPIPSEASTWQLLAPRPASPGASSGGSGSSAGLALGMARRTTLVGKLLGFALPTALGVIAFLLPLLWIVVPSCRAPLCWRPTAAAAVVGIAAILVGRVLTFTSVLQLRAQRRRGGGPPGGLFRWSRNPGLVGMYVCYAGLTIGYSAPLLAVVMPLYLWNMHRRVLLEESQLVADHGDRWHRYAARVPRYLPVPGRR